MPIVAPVRIAFLSRRPKSMYLSAPSCGKLPRDAARTVLYEPGLAEETVKTVFFAPLKRVSRRPRWRG
jgi:hypothetical protein